MDCAEGEDVNLPCNHSTIGRMSIYIGISKIPESTVCRSWLTRHSEQQHGLSDHSFRQKVQHLGPAPGHPERHRCVLLHPERGTLGQTGLHLCSISGGKIEAGQSCGSSHKTNLESSGRRIRRAVRHEGNEGKRNRRRWIKKRRERGQGIST